MLIARTVRKGQINVEHVKALEVTANLIKEPMIMMYALAFEFKLDDLIFKMHYIVGGASEKSILSLECFF